MNEAITLLHKALAGARAVLESQRIEYAVVGGVAVAVWGFARATYDVDFIVAANPESLHALRAAIGPPTFLFEPEEINLPRATVLRGHWPDRANPTEPDLVVVDFLVMEHRVADAVLTRRRQVTVGGSPTWVCAPEDLILLKVLSGRVKDLDDVRGVIQARGARLDRAYLTAAAQSWGFSNEVSALLDA